VGGAFQIDWCRLIGARRAASHTHAPTYTHARLVSWPASCSGHSFSLALSYALTLTAPLKPPPTPPHLWVLLGAVLSLLGQDVDVLVEPRGVDGVNVGLGLGGGMRWCDGWALGVEWEAVSRGVEAAEKLSALRG